MTLSTVAFKKLLAFALLAILLPTGVFAVGPTSMVYEGFLRNSLGVAQNGTAPITVRVYDAGTGGSLLFEETHPAISIAAGYFSVQVGAVGDSNPSTSASSFSGLLFNVNYFITTEIGSPFNTGEMTLSGGVRAPIALNPYAYNSRSISAFAVAPTGSINTGEVYFDTTNQIVYVYNGSVWTPLNGINTIGTGDIIDGSISSLDLAADSVTTTAIADGAVTGAKLLDGTVALADIAADAVDSSKILNNTISNIDISTGASIDYSKLNLAASITGGDIVNGSIGLVDIAADSIDSSKIANLSVTGADIADSTITFGKLQNVSALSILGNTSLSSGIATEITLGSGLAFGGSALGIDTTSALAWTGAGSFANILGLSLLPYGVSSGNTTSLNLRELAANGNNSVGFRAPDILAGTTTWTLPSGDGSVGQVLSTNGSGQLSWSNSSSANGASGSIQFASASGQFTSDNANFYWDNVNSRLGVGTNAPTQALSINAGNISHVYNGGNPIYAIGDASTAGNYGYMQWESSTDMLKIGAQASSSSLRLDENGAVLINTSTNVFSTPLQVKSNSGSSNVIAIQRNENSGSGLGFNTFRRGDGTELGYITCNLTGLTCGLFNASDLRVKEDIVTSTKGLEDLMNVDIRDYHVIGDEPGHVQQGVIAQELYNIYPQAVNRGDDNAVLTQSGKMWGVDYGKLTPLIIRAVQDQQLLINNSVVALLKSAQTVQDIQNESPRDSLQFFNNKIAIGGSSLADLATGRITALRGYFDSVYAEKVVAKTSLLRQLCVGTAEGHTCISREQLNALLQLVSVPSYSNLPPDDVSTDPTDTSGDGDGNTDIVPTEPVIVTEPENTSDIPATDSSSTPNSGEPVNGDPSTGSETL